MVLGNRSLASLGGVHQCPGGYILAQCRTRDDCLWPRPSPSCRSDEGWWLEGAGRKGKGKDKGKGKNKCKGKDKGKNQDKGRGKVKVRVKIKVMMRIKVKVRIRVRIG